MSESEKDSMFFEWGSRNHLIGYVCVCVLCFFDVCNDFYVCDENRLRLNQFLGIFIISAPIPKIFEISIVRYSMNVFKGGGRNFGENFQERH